MKLFLENATDNMVIMNYYNPNEAVTLREMKYYSQQLGKNFLMVGDLNGQTKMLDTNCKISNKTGRMLEKFVTSERVSLMNPINMYTYVSFSNLKRSCLDVCLGSENISELIQMKVERDIGSDHYPVSVEVYLKPAVQQLKIQKRWKLENINWEKWKIDIKNIGTTLPDTVENMNKNFTQKIIEASNKNIKKTSGKLRSGHRACWWTDEISKLVAWRRRARKKLEKHPTLDNLNDFKKKRDEVKKVIKRAKQASWENYVSTLQSQTPVKEVWSKIRAIKNKKHFVNSPLIDNGNIITDNGVKAALLATQYCTLASKEEFVETEEIRSFIRTKQESKSTDNSPFTIAELEQALRGLKETSPGIDEVTHSFLKHLPEEARITLLYIYNTSWGTTEIPELWKRGIIIPILKPGKDPTACKSYCPISLLSTIGKLLERMVKARLEWQIERNHILHRSQCGFRKGMSTMDILARLDCKIQKAFKRKQIALVVYVDLENAFDRVSHTGLIYKMAKNGIDGHMLKWIEEYLRDRKVKVRLFEEYSEEHRLEIGVPQGAVLSPVLFNLMLSDMPELEGVEILSYADDLTFVACGSNIIEIRNKMQQHIKDFYKWCDIWKIKINKGKTVMQVFSRKRDLLTPIIRIGSKIIEEVNEKKLLGLTWDSPKLNWKSHITNTANDCRRRLDLIKNISSTSWGASRKILKMFYITYIRGKMEYGCQIYGAACKSDLEPLKIIQNTALRYITGARNTTPILSLEAEAHIEPLLLRFQYLTVKSYVPKCIVSFRK